MALVHMSEASYRHAAQEVSHKSRDSQPFRFHPASPAFKHRPSNTSSITPLPNLSISHLLSHPIKPIPETDYEQQLHLSPYTLEQHDNLIPPRHGITPELLLSLESSSGVPQLTEVTSSTGSGQFTQPLRRSLTVSTIHSEGGNSDWEQLQIHVGGRTASMVEISNARLSHAAKDEVANSLLPGVCAVRMTSNATMCEIEESDEMLEEFGRQDDEEAIDLDEKCEEDLPDMDEEEVVQMKNQSSDIPPRIIKMRSTASTVIIHDYSRQTSTQTEEPQEIPLYENEVEFGRIHSYDPSTPSLPGLPSIPYDTQGIFPPQNTDRSGRNLERNNNDEFRRQMVERIRTKFSQILDDLDERIETQRKILADMS